MPSRCWTLIVALTAVIGCACHSALPGTRPKARPSAEAVSDSFDRWEGLTPEAWEQQARRHPPCETAGAPEGLVAYRWHVESLTGTLRLPAELRPDSAASEGVAQHWTSTDSSSMELMGSDAIFGLAVSGESGIPEALGYCTIPFLGRDAEVFRFQLIRGADTLHAAQVNSIVRDRAGVSVMVFAPSEVRLHDLLAALPLATLDR